MATQTTTTKSDPAAGIRHWPDLTRHYGLSWEELARMPNGVRKIYEKALPRLLAEEQLMAIDASGFPHMKKGAQGRMLRRLNRHAGGGQAKPAAQSKTPQEAQQRTAAAGIGMRLVPKDRGGDD